MVVGGVNDVVMNIQGRRIRDKEVVKYFESVIFSKGNDRNETLARI